MNDLLDVTLIVAADLENCGIPYTVGGSLASSLSGEPRASIDADIVVDLHLDQVDGLIGRLGDDFYADAEAIGAVTRGSSANLVHRTSGIKVALQENIRLAENRGATVVRAKADRPAEGLIAFGSEGVTHVIFAERSLVLGGRMR